jgi:hypothetical protein
VLRERSTHMAGRDSGVAGWYRDPFGRHERREWDGSVWTAKVRDGQFDSVDAPGARVPKPTPFSERDIRRFRIRLAVLPFALAGWTLFCVEVWHQSLVLVVGILVNMVVFGLRRGETRRRWAQALGRIPADGPDGRRGQPHASG